MSEESEEESLLDRVLLGWQAKFIPALVVEPNPSDIEVIASTLRSAGFTVTVTDNFKDAKALLDEAPPGVLVTEIRLGAYNGLQLAYRGKSAKPTMTIVLTSGYPDPVLQRDAERIGATFVLKPVTAREFIAAIYRSALRQPKPDGTFEPVRPPFERREADRRGESSIKQFLDVERRRTERRRVFKASRLR